jgi:hypothetical protein
VLTCRFLTAEVLVQAYKDMWFHELVLVRDFWEHANHFGWSLSSIHKAAFYVFGVQGNTKTYLEDLFGDLADKMTTHTNSEISEWTLYYNTIRSKRPLAQNPKEGVLAKQALKMIELQPLDCCNQEENFREKSVNLFNPKLSGVEELFDFDPLLADKNDGTWKPAGASASRRSYTSYAMLKALESCDFRGVSMAWSSVLLLRHRVYLRRSDGGYFISFGFEGWASIGWRLQKLIHRQEGVDKVFFGLLGGEQGEPLVTLLSTRLSPDPTVTDTEDFAGVPFELRCLSCIGGFM